MLVGGVGETIPWRRVRDGFWGMICRFVDEIPLAHGMIRYFPASVNGINIKAEFITV